MGNIKKRGFDFKCFVPKLQVFSVYTVLKSAIFNPRCTHRRVTVVCVCVCVPVRTTSTIARNKTLKKGHHKNQHTIRMILKRHFLLKWIVPKLWRLYSI